MQGLEYLQKYDKNLSQVKRKDQQLEQKAEERLTIEFYGSQKKLRVTPIFEKIILATNQLVMEQPTAMDKTSIFLF